MNPGLLKSWLLVELLLIGCAGRAPDEPLRGRPHWLSPGAAIPAAGQAWPRAALEPTGDQVEPFDLLLAAARRLHRIRTLQGFIEQRIVLDGQPVTLQVRFAYARPDRLRYEYLDPVRQSLVSDGQTLWLLPPRPTDTPGAQPPAPAWSARRLAELAPTERAALGLVPGYGFDPLAALPVDAYTYAFEQHGPESATIRLTPRQPGLPLLRIRLDPATAWLRELEFHPPEPGSVCTVRYDRYQETAGIALPRESRTHWQGAGHELIVESRFRSLRVNEELPTGWFRPEADGTPER